MKYMVMGSTIKDTKYAFSVYLHAKSLDLKCYTSVHTVECEHIEDLPDLCLDQLGEELDLLYGYVYLYVMTPNGWVRITG